MWCEQDMFKVQVFVTLVLSSLVVVEGYSHFRDLIPNGKNVPHPCRPNYTWKGVGHENQAGGGDRNPFGEDFDANGKVWDECLCQTDSDGDGRTNGEELGDPYCDWSPGDIPYTQDGLSHPGICEPMLSDLCQHQNDWEVDCSSPEFICDELEEAEDVANITVQLSSTLVPAKETTYICQGMELPSDETYHMIASEPVLVNENVIHHIIIFSCPDNAIDEAKDKFSEPVECDMAPFPCAQTMQLWTLGVSGSCLAPEYGMPIGLAGTKYIVLQLHWNNPELRDDYEDSSGLILHYTPNLRSYNGAIMTVGPAHLELPPGYTEIVDDGTCPKECMEYMFKENVYIAEIIPHMHYLGRKMAVEQWRNGELIATLVDDQDYSYDSPAIYKFSPALEIRRSDEIYISCTYETRDKGSFTLFGDATADEMCSAIVTYYPNQPNATFCSTYDKITYCGVTLASTEIGEQCLREIFIFLAIKFDNVLSQLYSTCDPTGLTCMAGCDQMIGELRHNHTCLHEDADELTMGLVAYYEGRSNDFILMWLSCNDWPEKQESVATTTDAPPGLCPDQLSSSPAFRVSGVTIAILVLSKFCLW